MRVVALEVVRWISVMMRCAVGRTAVDEEYIGVEVMRALKWPRELRKAINISVPRSAASR
jgi:hypothetical protein